MTVTLPLECHQPARYRNWLQVGVPVWPARSGTSPAPMELSPARCAEVSLVVIFNGSSLGDRLRAGDEGGERGGEHHAGHELWNAPPITCTLLALMTDT